jgi:hypothetical protein
MKTHKKVVKNIISISNTIQYFLAEYRSYVNAAFGITEHSKLNNLYKNYGMGTQSSSFQCLQLCCFYPLPIWQR